MKNKGGRPLKLTSEVKEALISGVKEGLTLKAACKGAGISGTLPSPTGGSEVRRNQRNEEPTPLAQFVAEVDIEVIYLQREHRLTVRANRKPRDYRYGWKNPMPDEIKQKLRIKAFEQAIENDRRRRESW